MTPTPRNSIMTNKDRDIKLIQMDTKLDNILDALDRDRIVLHGPKDQPGTGLLARVQAIEDQHIHETRHVGWVLAALGFLINAAIAIYAATKK